MRLDIAWVTQAGNGANRSMQHAISRSRFTDAPWQKSQKRRPRVDRPAHGSPVPQQLAITVSPATTAPAYPRYFPAQCRNAASAQP